MASSRLSCCQRVPVCREGGPLVLCFCVHLSSLLAWACWLSLTCLSLQSHAGPASAPHHWRCACSADRAPPPACPSLVVASAASSSVGIAAAQQYSRAWVAHFLSASILWWCLLKRTSWQLGPSNSTLRLALMCAPAGRGLLLKLVTSQRVLLCWDWRCQAADLCAPDVLLRAQCWRVRML